MKCNIFGLLNHVNSQLDIINKINELRLKDEDGSFREFRPSVDLGDIASILDNWQDVRDPTVILNGLFENLKVLKKDNSEVSDFLHCYCLEEEANNESNK